MRARGTTELKDVWEHLPPVVRWVVSSTGFGRLASALDETPRSTAVLCALGERWWDTTHTFHFGFGEMTVTPIDVQQLLGLDCDGEQIEVDRSLRVRPEAVRAALDDVGRIVSGDSIRLSLLKDVLLCRVIDVEDGL